MALQYLILSAVIAYAHSWYNSNHDLNGWYEPEYLFRPKVVYDWKVMEFGFPSEQARQEAGSAGQLKPRTAMLIDVQPYRNKDGHLRTFVTLPRFQNGTPYTLATVSDQYGATGPLLQPYPNYNIHRYDADCNGITSAFRVALTECNQMWVIDSGMIGTKAVCPPQLLLFDLNTDQIVHRYKFNTALYTPGSSMFINPIVNVRNPPPRGDCSHTMVYVADVNYHGLVVYAFNRRSAWRIENRFMYPDPNYGLHSIAGERFVLMDGIFGMATDKKHLYFHPLASNTEYMVPLSVIDNSTLFESNKENMYTAFERFARRKSPCAASAMDRRNNLYCVTFDPIELVVYQTGLSNRFKYTRTKIADPDVLQFVSGMKVVRNHEGHEELWLVSNRYQKMAAGTQNFNEINFRIVKFHLGSRRYFSAY